MKTVDVIIPTYKPGKGFLSMLDALFQQSYPISRILIINTEKKYWDALDDFVQIQKQHPNLEVLHITEDEFDHAATRQMAAQLSTADIFVMMTMDAVPENKKLIEELVEGIVACREDGTKVAVSYARQLPKQDAGLIECYTRRHNYPAESMLKTKRDLPRLGIKTFFCSDVCAAYDRQLFVRLGGFVPKAIFNEDMIYAAKAVENGYGIYYAATASVFHSHNYSGFRQFQRNFDLGVSHAQHPEVFAAVPPESAGIQMVKQTAAYLCRCKKPWLILKLIWQSGCKYLGYRAGKAYQKLPGFLILKWTSFPGYWKRGKK